MQISIVMPTYNGMKYLEQAIGSVLSQQYQNWELIISDDGSNDGTRDYLASLIDPRIKVHLQSSNKGIFGNLNFLFEQVGSDLTQILCQDDYLIDDGALDRLLNEWSHLSPDIAFLRCNHTRNASSSLERFESEVLPTIVQPEQSDLLFFTFGCLPGNLSNVSVRTHIVKSAGWFRPDLPYAGDFEFWSRAGRSHPWAISETKVSVIRSHSEQASKTLNKAGELLPQLRSILDTLYGNLRGRGYSSARLRLMASVNYIALGRDIGVKALVKGKGSTYLRGIAKEFDSADFAFGSIPGWAIYFTSLGGRVLRVSAARQLLKAVPAARLK